MFYVAGRETVQRDIARATNKLVDLRDVKVLRARRQTLYDHTLNHINEVAKYGYERYVKWFMVLLVKVCLRRCSPLESNELFETAI